MNKQGPGKIEYCDWTWNPVSGCLHSCPYCYARRMAMRFQGHFKPTYHPEKLYEPIAKKKPQRIFICSTADLFGEWTGKEIIKDILKITQEANQHQYLFLTKNPKRYFEFNYSKQSCFPPNCWLGQTVDGIHSHFDPFGFLSADHHFVSCEPLLADVSRELHYSLLDWIIIGGQTGPGAVKPKKEWIENIIKKARARGIPVFLKSNLHWTKKIQEYPAG